MTPQEVCLHPEQRGQILKTRDDPSPILIERDPSAGDPRELFKLASGIPRSWAKQDQSFGPEKLRSRIEPWITSLVQSEHLSLLVGSGLTHGVHKSATGERRTTVREDDDVLALSRPDWLDFLFAPEAGAVPLGILNLCAGF